MLLPDVKELKVDYISETWILLNMISRSKSNSCKLLLESVCVSFYVQASINSMWMA